MYVDKGKEEKSTTNLLFVLNSTISWLVQRDDEHSSFEMPSGI